MVRDEWSRLLSYVKSELANKTRVLVLGSSVIGVDDDTIFLDVSRLSVLNKNVVDPLKYSDMDGERLKAISIELEDNLITHRLLFEPEV